MEVLMKKKKVKTKKKRRPKRKVIYLVGEGTGETIDKIARASLAQFSQEKVNIKTFFMVADEQQIAQIVKMAAQDADEQQIAQIVKMAAQDKALVAFSIVHPPLRTFLIDEATRRGI
jgi:regulator of PEP synthase PpsR (kinase-PPPase family)